MAMEPVSCDGMPEVFPGMIPRKPPQPFHNPFNTQASFEVIQ
jgi:hypothetical protein